MNLIARNVNAIAIALANDMAANASKASFQLAAVECFCIFSPVGKA